MNDTWVGPVGALFLLGCCLVPETGLIGSRVATGLAALGYSWVGVFVVGVTGSILVTGWVYHRWQASESQGPVHGLFRRLYRKFAIPWSGTIN